MTDELLSEHHDRVAVLTLNRPERRNALSAAVNAAIAEQLDAWADDNAVRAVVLTGAGKAFCAGFDLTELGDPERQRPLLEGSGRYHRTVWSFPKPIVCAVNGPALAGGFDLATLCDLRLAGESATFGHPEVKFGVPPIFTPLRWLIGDGIARDLCMTGRTIDAAEAHRIGLVSQVHPDGDLLDRAIETAASIGEAPAESLAMFKAFATGVQGAFEAAFRAEHDAPFARILEGTDGGAVADAGAGRLRELGDS